MLFIDFFNLVILAEAGLDLSLDALALDVSALDVDAFLDDDKSPILDVNATPLDDNA